MAQRMPTRPLIISSLIGVVSDCLLLAPTPASAASSAHPCLEALSATTLPEERHYLAPAGIKTGSEETWKLDGIILEHLKPTSLARLKRKEIEKTLDRQALQAFANKNAKADRRGRQAAFIALPPATDGKTLLLQEQLAEKGLVRIDVETLSPACAKRLLAKEQMARQAKRGVWKEPSLSDKNSPPISTFLPSSPPIKSFTAKCRRSHATTTAPAISISAPTGKQTLRSTLSEKSLATWEAENKSLDALKNAYIYVRGWVEKRGGAADSSTSPGAAVARDAIGTNRADASREKKQAEWSKTFKRIALKIDVGTKI